MNRCGELMALFLQETEEKEETERKKTTTTTIVDLLTERTMNTGDRLRRRRSLNHRLRLNRIVCCGSTWRFGASTSAVNTQPHSDEEEETEFHNETENGNDVVDNHHQQQQQIDENMDVNLPNSDPECFAPSPRMNLAAALAAEREFRAAAVVAEEEERPLKRSLMRLLEESEMEMEMEMEGQDEEMGKDQVCCVCMGRKKGGALIPCGHTYCRVCCRELWLNRGTCPLCNRSILEILDIY